MWRKTRSPKIQQSQILNLETHPNKFFEFIKFEFYAEQIKLSHFKKSPLFSSCLVFSMRRTTLWDIVSNLKK